MIAIYPGSFDPATYGHADIIQRSAGLADRLIVAVLNNSEKKPLFTLEERVEQLKGIIKDCPNVDVRPFSGLLANFVKEIGADAIIRGIRNASEVEYELQIAWVNKTQSGVDTIFLPADARYRCLSSSIVREMAKYGGDMSSMVPLDTINALREKYKRGGL